MKKINFFLGLLWFFLGLSASANLKYTDEKQILLNSKITNVTVFISGAQVQRQAENFEVPQGVSLLVFSGLSAAIEAQSIQATGEGNFTILSVTQQRNFLLEKKTTAEKTNYLALIDDLTDKIWTLKSESEVNKAEEEMLGKNQVVMGPNVNYDLTKLKQALDFQKQRLTEVKNKQVQINNAIVKLQIELNKYNQQLNELNGKSITNSNDIVVKVSAKAAVKGKLSLTYLVKNAGWYPTYDIRVKDISSPVALVYKANVSQSSGEDWKNIKLTLSSGNPSSNSVKPNLAPYNLGFLSDGYTTDVASTQPQIVKGKIVASNNNQSLIGASVRVKNSSVATVTDANGNFMLQIPRGSNTLIFSYIGYKTREMPVSFNLMNVRLEIEDMGLNEVEIAKKMNTTASQVRIAGVQANKSMATNAVEVNTLEKQTNVVFDIKNPYTILSDGQQFSVDIGNYDFKSDYEYYAAPKISEEAFLTAKINGFDEVNLITGEANIFFEGTYLGKSLLDIENASDTLTISLGVDKNVVVKREKQKDFNEKQFIGSSQRDNRSFVFDIRNRKNQPINLIVEDQVPISTSSDITVERQEISKGKYNETNGSVTWQMLLQPNEQKKLLLKYQVKYPKNKPINLK